MEAAAHMAAVQAFQGQSKELAEEEAAVDTAALQRARRRQTLAASEAVLDQATAMHQHPEPDQVLWRRSPMVARPVLLGAART